MRKDFMVKNLTGKNLEYSENNSYFLDRRHSPKTDEEILFEKLEEDFRSLMEKGMDYSGRKIGKASQNYFWTEEEKSDFEIQLSKKIPLVVFWHGKQEFLGRHFSNLLIRLKKKLPEISENQYLVWDTAEVKLENWSDSEIELTVRVSLTTKTRKNREVEEN